MENKTSLKEVATKGMLWNSIEKFSVQGSQFLIGILLARLLIPADFGLIGMIAIFIAIAQTFVDSGMGSGLIQRQNRSLEDYSTVFVFNFVVSLFFYILLFISAPYIADFYNTPALIPITRVIGINIIINSLSIVQRSMLTVELNFKTLAKINILSIMISGVCAIYFAYTGFGVWSLVYRQLIGSIVSVVLFWYFSKWKTSFVFSKKSFKDLFGYGSKILASGIYAQIFQNMYNIFIGKAYSASNLGFYTQAKQLAEVTAGTVTSILQQVTFPILAALQDDKERMILVYRRLIRMTAFFIFPTMTILAVLADPFVNFFLGTKWMPMVPLLQWMCFARILYPLSALNMNILNANGRSDLFLKVDLSKAPLTIIALIITIPISLKAMIVGQVITTFISFFINAYLPGKLYGYGPFSQIRDIWPIIVTTLITALVTYSSIQFIHFLILKLTIGSLIAIAVYFAFSYLFKIQEIEEINSILRSFKKR